MRIVIVGGAGFIGTNAAEMYAAQGHDVVVLDNFSRPGSRTNAQWLHDALPRIEISHVDVRSDVGLLSKYFKTADIILHEAGQVAVTTSVIDPRTDFEVNALGTFNVLEALRAVECGQILLFASTNKVYGNLEHLAVVQRNGRYEFESAPQGVAESEQLDFHSPYGCSKGSADQYVRDYARIYGLRTVVFRQSCIYGPHQFGVEDQGWVAWFSIAASLGLPVTIFGDGLQIRDVLHVRDLFEAYVAATEQIDVAAGEVFNVGGGPRNTMSLLELVEKLQARYRRPLNVRFDDWRPGDQRVFVSSIEKAKAQLGWTPRTSVDTGLTELCDWIDANQPLFEAKTLIHA